MCFAASKKKNADFQPIENDDSSINDNNNSQIDQIDIENYPQHIDYPFLDKSQIDGFVYETKDYVIVVYVSEEAEQKYASS